MYGAEGQDAWKPHHGKVRSKKAKKWFFYHVGKEKLWRNFSFWLKAEHFLALWVTGVVQSLLSSPNFAWKLLLAMRNLARHITIWGPTPTWESTSNAMKSFNSCGTFPKMPCCPQIGISAWTLSMEAPEPWSLPPALGPHQPLVYQLAE